MDDDSIGSVPTFATIFLIVWKVFWSIAFLCLLIGGPVFVILLVTGH